MSAPSQPRQVVLATRNAHKVEELGAILADVCARHGLTVVALPDDAPEVIENGTSFEANSLLKARSAAAHTGCPAIADDSGLSVEVMGGMPGIFSARWSGGQGDRANLELLLAQLGDVPDDHRAGAFMCAAALVMPDGREVVETGRFPGVIAREPKGTNGFGYDPIFVPDGQGQVGHARTLAEYEPVQKNAVSHRAIAFAALAPHLDSMLGG